MRTDEAGANRREHERFPGPFDGRRIGLLDTPVRIYDLSAGGCFINSMHDQQPGIEVVLEIDLPSEGVITVKAETVYRRPGFGFAVRFTEMSDDDAKRLERALERLRNHRPSTH